MIPLRSALFRRLSSRIRKNKYVGFDVETVGDKNLFYSGGVYYREGEKEHFFYFKEKDRLAKFLLSRRFRNRYIVATNLDFDFTVLFYNTPYWNDFKQVYRDSKLLLASYDLGQNHGKVRFIDTMNYVFFSVEKLGNIIGVPKLEKPMFLGREPTTYEEDLELQRYNKNDCRISHDFMIFLQEGINSVGGTVKLTIASSALHTWRSRFMPCDVFKEQYVLRDDDINDFIFEGYYGGRTEVFKRGEFKNINYYDVNSLYPFVMRGVFPFPSSARKVPRGREDVAYIQRYEGVSEVLVTAPKMHKPFLPYRLKGKLVFPTGSFRGVYNHCELRKAIDLGYSIVPVRQLYYTRTWSPFRSYVDSFYALRLQYKKEGSAFEFVVKLLLNSLYGKFGSRWREDYRIIDMSTEKKTFLEYAELTRGKNYDIVGDKIIIRDKKKVQSIYSFPILASYVTSYARMHMYDFINTDDVIYTDTDSIITTGTIPGCDLSLGNLKHEGLYDSGMFVKPKFYRLGDMVKLKGLSRAVTQDFDTVLTGGGVQKMRFSRLRESARRGKNPNEITTITKCMTLRDDKRTWDHHDLTRVSDSVPLEVFE